MNSLQFNQSELDTVSDKVLSFIPLHTENELIANKNVFLEKLKSSGGKNKYKRYLGSPLRYAGGKSLAVGMILDIMPNNIERVVSPFIGGGALEIACAKELKIPVKAFDIFDILVSYWQVQIKSPKKLYSALKQFKPNKDEFYAVKKVMKSHWENEIKLKKLIWLPITILTVILLMVPIFWGGHLQCICKKKDTKKH